MQNHMESKSNDEDLLINEMTEKKLEFENKESQTGDKWVYLKNLRYKIRNFPASLLLQWFVLVMMTFDDLFKNKSCTKCRQYVLLSDFYTDRQNLDNCASQCIDCVKDGSKRTADLKSAIMKVHFERNCCVDCGESNPLVLENDHVLDNKHISRTGRRSQGLQATPLKGLCDMLLTCENVCTRCHTIRTESRRSKSNPDDLSQTYEAIKRRKRRGVLRKIVNDEKLRIGRCQVDGCDFWDPNHLYVFQFNHKNPKTKVKAVSAMIDDRASKADIIKEMEKCDLLCGNCHKIITANQLGFRSLEDFPKDIVRKARKMMDEAIERKKMADAKKSKGKNGKRKIKNDDGKDQNEIKKQKIEEEKE